ncbi:MAG: hypothetical protein ACRDBG_06535 [Waterburya sp.]
MTHGELLELTRSALCVTRAAYPDWCFTKQIAVRETLKQLTGRVAPDSIPQVTKIIECEF